MANSQPPNEPRCNLVALLSVTKQNSWAFLQEAMKMNLEVT